MKRKIKTITSALLVITFVLGTFCFSPIKANAFYNNELIESLISKNVDLQRVFLARIAEYESSLNEISLLNKDFTFTTLYFNSPIKYINKQNIVCDKSNDIKSIYDLVYSHKTYHNDVLTYFPRYAKSGIKITFGDHKVYFYPLSDNNSHSILDNGNIVYNGIFGSDDISLKFTPDFNGFEKSIIMNNETDVGGFTFKVRADGLTLNSINNRLFLNDSDGNIVTEIGNLNVSDSNGKNYTTLAEYNYSSDEDCYYITYDISAALVDNSIAYPLTISDSLTKIYENTGLSQSIISNYGTYKSTTSLDTIGYTGNALPNRILVNIDNFKSIYADNYKDSNVLSMSYNLYFNTATAEATARAYLMTSDWRNGLGTSDDYDEIVSTYNAYGSLLSTNNIVPMPTGIYYSFNLMDAFKLWMQNNSGAVNSSTKEPHGIMIKLDSENSVSQRFATPSSSVPPYISITHVNYEWYSQKSPANSTTSWYDSSFDNISFSTPASYGSSTASGFYPAIALAGCNICSYAMVLQALNATTTTSHTIAVGTKYTNKKLSPDPITCIFANCNWPSISGNIIQVSHDPTNVYYNRLTNAFGYSYNNINSNTTNANKYYSGTNFSSLSNSEKKEIVYSILIDHPEGVIIGVDSHYMVARLSYNESSKSFKTNVFRIYDPSKTNESDGASKEHNNSIFSSTINDFAKVKYVHFLTKQ